MSYREVMRTPLRAFWSLNAQVNRLRAEDSLQKFELFLLASPNFGGDEISRVRHSLTQRMSTPVVTREVGELKQHREGIAKLRELKARMSGTQMKGGNP